MGPRRRVRFPAATREDHRRFCESEGWQLVRSATGNRSTHHETYELALPEGDVLRTRISRPPDRTVYGSGLWSHILRDQLLVSQQEFWQCVNDGIPPPRSRPVAPTQSIPTEVLYLLKLRVGLTDDQLADMTAEAAIERLQQYWTTGE